MREDIGELREQQTRGQRAGELLENILLAEALTAIETEVIHMWEHCPQRDKDGKEALWQLYKTSRKFRTILTGYIESGKLATQQLADFEKRSAMDRLLRQVKR